MQQRQHEKREQIFARCRRKATPPPPSPVDPPPPVDLPPVEVPFSLPTPDDSEDRPFDLLLQLAFPKVASMITVDSWRTCIESRIVEQ